ncbi:hypothetical protein RYX36_031572 [Vicia faba]
MLKILAIDLLTLVMQDVDLGCYRSFKEGHELHTSHCSSWCTEVLGYGGSRLVNLNNICPVTCKCSSQSHPVLLVWDLLWRWCYLVGLGIMSLALCCTILI